MPILSHTIVNVTFNYLVNYLNWEHYDNGNLDVDIRHPRPKLSTVRRYIRGIRTCGLQTHLVQKFTDAHISICISLYDVPKPRVVDRPVPRLDDREDVDDPEHHFVGVAGVKF